MRSFTFAPLVRAIAVTALTFAVFASAAAAGTFNPGDVFVGVGGGQIKQFSPTGALLATLDTTSNAAEDTGMCFDQGGNLYSTNFAPNTMTKFDNSGNLLIYPFGGGFNADPESCVADAAGNIYVGQADGGHTILKFSPTGASLGATGTLVTDRGTDWIDLAADQCTMYYNGEGSTIRRYDVCTNTQLADFATGLQAPCYALRIRSNGDVLSACANGIVRLNSAGSVVQTYPLPATETSFFFAMNLDPNGTSFWTAGFFSGNVYHYDIASGLIVNQFNAGVSSDAAGLAIFAEPQVGGGGGGGGTQTDCSKATRFVGADSLTRSGIDTDKAGLAEAFRATATASGSASVVCVYLDPTNTASALSAAVYADNGLGHPGTLLAQGSLTGAPTNGAFNTIQIPSLPLVSGTTYWIALLSPSATPGTLKFRDHCCGYQSSPQSGPSENSLETNLTAFPASWSTGKVWPRDGLLMGWSGG